MRLPAFAIGALALCLAGCATTSGGGVTDEAISAAQAAFSATVQIVDQDVQAGILTAPQALKVKGYLASASAALGAAQSALAAKDAATEQERINEVTTALVQVNAAIVDALTAGR